MINSKKNNNNSLINSKDQLIYLTKILIKILILKKLKNTKKNKNEKTL